MKLRLALAVFSITLLAATRLPLAAPADRDASLLIAHAQLARLAATERTVAWQADLTDCDRTLARIYTLDPAGYVVVAADTDLPPVIAYALDASYPDDAPADNPLRRLLTADLTSRLAALDRLDPATRAAWRAAWTDLRDGAAEPARFEQWPPEGSTPTGGWLQSNWTQNAPYNNLCPRDLAGGGGRSVAGCPAVAMGMILNYHETIQGTAFGLDDRYWHSYAGNAYWIDDAAEQYDFADFPTLNGHLATLTDHWTAGVALTATDKAALVFACGVAARQVYSAGGSGTFGVDQAYDAYLRFGFQDCALLTAADTDLFPRLAAEIQEGSPAHLAVVDPGWTMGHNVVVDGYNSDDYYHLNFGWGGPYNGWYLLPEEIPYGLTVIEGVVLDIQPAVSAAGGDTAPAAPAATHLVAHPNPFNPRTTVTFTAPAAAHARLTIYDLAGRRVAAILDEQVAAGRHAVSWTPHDQPSGVYFARLELGDEVTSTRVVLAK